MPFLLFSPLFFFINSAPVFISLAKCFKNINGLNPHNNPISTLLILLFRDEEKETTRWMLSLKDSLPHWQRWVHAHAAGEAAAAGSHEVGRPRPAPPNAPPGGVDRSYQHRHYDTARSMPRAANVYIDVRAEWMRIPQARIARAPPESYAYDAVSNSFHPFPTVRGSL